MAEQHLADATGVNKLLGRVDLRIETELKAHLHDPLGGLGGVDGHLAVLHRESQGLLGVKVPPDFENGDVHVPVRPIRDRLYDGIDILELIEHFAEVGVSDGGAACLGDRLGGLGGALGENIADGDDLDSGHLKHVPQQIRASIPDADKGNAHLVAAGLGAETPANAAAGTVRNSRLENGFFICTSS
mgnify:CR=1 FL=1